MSNSSLVSYTKISPNKTSPRNHAIDTITIHCVVGQLSAEQIASCFVNSSAQASCNYGIGTDGRIALIVEEKDRSWCSGGKLAPINGITGSINDHRAITIECACDRTHPYAINDAVYKSLIELCADICKRNGIKELKWKGDKSLVGKVDQQNMTVHRWFANKECPGDYIYERLGQIAADVNKKLGVSDATIDVEPEKAEAEDTSNYTKIMGKPVATVEQMLAHIRKKNPNVPQSVIDMIPFYLSEGNAEGVAGDVAFAQSCIETGNFVFPESTCAVTLDQNNFAMMGVVTTFAKGLSFDTPQLGIRAQIQHLKAYASTDALNGECIDPRFKYVTRGSAPYVEWLGMQENPQGKGWASAKGYGSSILRVLNEVRSIKVEAEEPAAKPVETESETVQNNSNPTIRSGSTGSYVKKAQERLNAHGASLNVDGSFGPLTLAAVKKFQKEKGLDVDGVVGPKTWAALEAEPEKVESATKVEEFKSYMVKVTSAALNVRSGPGTNYGVNMCIRDKGTYTIVAESNGWGKLKSGAGWINLNYTTKV